MIWNRIWATQKEEQKVFQNSFLRSMSGYMKHISPAPQNNIMGYKSCRLGYGVEFFVVFPPVGFCKPVTQRNLKAFPRINNVHVVHLGE